MSDAVANHIQGTLSKARQWEITRAGLSSRKHGFRNEVVKENPANNMGRTLLLLDSIGKI